MEFKEDFIHYENIGVMNLTIPVVPEYSYLITGSYRTNFGSLTSKNLSVAGEIENMLRKVGCYIRKDFVFNEEKTLHAVVGSAINCSEACHRANETCNDGWSYQIATKRCYFYERFNIEKLQPNTHILPNELTIGWATGLKSCSEPGK